VADEERTQQVPAWGAPPQPPPQPQPQPPAWGAPPPPPPPGYGPAPYGQPPAGSWGAPQAAPPSNGLAIGALVLGIGSLLFAFIPFVGFASVPFAIGAVVLGVIGLGKSRENGQGKGLAIGGLVTGAVALAVSVLYVLLFIVIADDVEDDGGINTDPSNGVCDSDRFFQDPDC
jgi:hypothetical protein